MGRAVAGGGWRILVPLTAAGAGLLFATSASTAHGTDLRAGRRLQLTQLVGEQRRQEAGSEQRAARLRRQVRRDTRTAAAGSSVVAAEQASAAALEAAAGLTAVTGPALTVRLDDAPASGPGRPPTAGSPDDLVVHQQDVQAVVNGLWAGGAEAMTLMGQRVVSTSAVRCVGSTLLLHGRVYSPPFTVTAIGDPVRLRAAMERDPGVVLLRRYVDVFGLRLGVQRRAAVTLPAYDGSVDLPDVRAAGG